MSTDDGIVAVFLPSPSPFLRKYLVNLAASWPREVLFQVYTDSNDWYHDLPLHPDSLARVELNVDLGLRYLYKSKDHRIYKGFLDTCYLQDSTRAILPRLEAPEYLLSELNFRQEDTPKIVASTFGTHDIAQHGARFETYKSILNHSNFKALFVHSIAPKFSAQAPKFGQLLVEQRDKVRLTYDPLYDRPARYLAIEPTVGVTKRVLFFGSWFYGKGIDLLLDASELIGEEVQLIIAGDSSTKNFAFEAAKLGFSWITVLDHFIDDDEMFRLFRSVDLVVLPYRDTYEYNTSGVFVQAVSAMRQMVVPNFPPFSTVLEDYPALGKTFSSGDAVDLADTIRLAIKNPPNDQEFSSQALEYLNRADCWKSVASEIIERVI